MSERPTSVRWRVFGLMVATSWLLYLHRYIFSLLKPILSREWDLSNEELGRIESAFGLAYTICQFPLALLADLFGAHVLLPMLLVVWLCGLGHMGRATNTDEMWSGQALLATGQSAVYACLNRVGRMWYPASIRTTLQGFVAILAGRLGGACAPLIFATLLMGYLELSWQAVIWWSVSVGIVLLVLILATLSDSPRQHVWVNDAEARLIAGTDADASVLRSRPSIRQMLAGCSPRSLRNLSFVTLSSFLSTVADTVFASWIPLFLSQVHHLNFREMGIYSALPLLGGALAGPVGGALNDSLIARTGNRRWSRALIAVMGKGMAAILLLSALALYDQPYLFCISLFFVKFFGDWSLASLWGVIADIGGRSTASVFALNNSMAAIGMTVAPILFGFTADRYGWPAVFITAAATLAACALSWLAIDSTISVSEEKTDRAVN